jgi:isocitrate dehydrogenase
MIKLMIRKYLLWSLTFFTLSEFFHARAQSSKDLVDLVAFRPERGDQYKSILKACGGPTALQLRMSAAAEKLENLGVSAIPDNSGLWLVDAVPV